MTTPVRPPLWPQAPVLRRPGPWGEELAAACSALPGQLLFEVPPELILHDPGPDSSPRLGSPGARLAARWLERASAEELAAAEASWEVAAPEVALEPVLPELSGSCLGWLIQARLNQQAAERAALAEAGGPVHRRGWAAARWWVASRAFGLGPPRGLALVPGLELLDHDDPGNATWELLPEGSVGVYASAAISPGEALRHPYGRRSDLRWLLGWGFTLPENARQEAILCEAGLPPVPLALPPSPEDLAATWAALGVRAEARPETVEAIGARCAAALARLPPGPPPSLDPAWSERVGAVLQAERAVLEAWA